MLISKVMVIGGGVMGRGISRLLAGTGIEVTLVDLSQEIIKESLKLLSEEMDLDIQKWGMTESEKKAILSRIKWTTEYDDALEVDLVVEAVPEDLKLKQMLLAKLDEATRPEIVLISHTSTLSITEIAATTKRPDKVIGLHFLPPVTKIPLVEVVRGLKTSPETLDLIKEFAEQHLDKTVVTVYEYPGYVTTRIIVPLLNEAMHVLMEGIATAEDIDTAMKLGYGFNIGPLALADMMGLDEVMKWMENLIHELSDHKYNPCPLLRKLVRAGHLGKKTGQGFFKYDEEGNKIGEADLFPR
ncbi:MAG: 3-hydroxybutyryl-CoA dehydrogenase [candidate division Zixibacteria bacterium]|nr:3-hydroxybutyryl-CoA dehydrogenase [candidate division Zixibacteria bacterium]